MKKIVQLLAITAMFVAADLQSARFYNETDKGWPITVTRRRISQPEKSYIQPKSNMDINTDRATKIVIGNDEAIYTNADELQLYESGNLTIKKGFTGKPYLIDAASKRELKKS